MRHLPDMHYFKDIEYVRTVFLKALSYFHFEREQEPKPWEEKEDIYAILPADWEKTLKLVTGDTKGTTVKEWKRLFRDLGWMKAKKGKLYIQRRFHGSKPISVVGIDKKMYNLLKAMEPIKGQEKRENEGEIQDQKATTEKR